LHDVIKGRDYGQLKDLISDRKWECVSETCWKQQKTKEEIVMPSEINQVESS